MKSLQKRVIGLIAISLLCLLATSCSSTKTLVVLLPEERNQKGSVAIDSAGKQTILDSPMTAASVDNYGRVKKTAVTKADIEKDFKQALEAQPPEATSLTLYFEEGKTVVVTGSIDALMQLFEEVAKRQAVEVQITGHTDTVGTTDDNDRLSQERAKAIKEALIAQGLQAKFVRSVGRGERELLVSTPDNFPEPKNRRVEIIIR